MGTIRRSSTEEYGSPVPVPVPVPAAAVRRWRWRGPAAARNAGWPLAGTGHAFAGRLLIEVVLRSWWGATEHHGPHLPLDVVTAVAGRWRISWSWRCGGSWSLRRYVQGREAPIRHGGTSNSATHQPFEVSKFS
jgi:hypothetical protein